VTIKLVNSLVLTYHEEKFDLLIEKFPILKKSNSLCNFVINNVTLTFDWYYNAHPYHLIIIKMSYYLQLLLLLNVADDVFINFFLQY